MAGNNSSGGHSLCYGIMADNVLAIDAILADGREIHFEDLPEDLSAPGVPQEFRDLFAPLLDLGAREADEIAARFPKVPAPRRRLQHRTPWFPAIPIGGAPRRPGCWSDRRARWRSSGR